MAEICALIGQIRGNGLHESSASSLEKLRELEHIRGQLENGEYDPDFDPYIWEL